MNGKVALQLMAMALFGMLFFSIMGCPPVDENAQRTILKALSSGGCQGCNGCFPEEGEGEPVEGESEGEGEIIEGESPEGEVAEGEGEVEPEGEPEPGEMAAVAAGTFQMGRPYTDTGFEDELPVHSVSLDAYEIGKYAVTNEQFAAVLNWAHRQGYLFNSANDPYAGGTVYAHGQSIVLTKAGSGTSYSQIVYNAGAFHVNSREGYSSESFSMAGHPVLMVSWYGAVAYCNWLSEQQGLQPCYDTSTWTRYEPVRNGYRLPTEAEWERAAAWESAGGGKHWRYGMTSDTIDITRANAYDGLTPANPLGLTDMPYTAPVDWYNGINPARLSTPATLTVNALSPVGAVGMSGNTWEWCHDLYAWDYYTGGSMTNPTGAATGTYRVMRGGSWYTDLLENCRTADRLARDQSAGGSTDSFRIARTP